MIELSEKAVALVKQYADGLISAEAAAYEIWKGKLSTEPDPRAVDIIIWSKELGFGIPCLSDEEAQEQARRCDEYLREHQAL